MAQVNILLFTPTTMGVDIKKFKEESQMTNERIQAIAEALANNDELRKAVLAMEPAEAADALKKEGYDFTADELIDFAKLVADATAEGELDADSLDSVSGGSITVWAAIGGGAFVVKVAYDVGKAIGKNVW